MNKDDHTLVLEQLRATRTDLGEIKERAWRMETRLSSIEHTVGRIYASAGDDRAATQSLTRRIERIERPVERTDD